MVELNLSLWFLEAKTWDPAASGMAPGTQMSPHFSVLPPVRGWELLPGLSVPHSLISSSQQPFAVGTSVTHFSEEETEARGGPSIVTKHLNLVWPVFALNLTCIHQMANIYLVCAMGPAQCQVLGIEW